MQGELMKQTVILALALSLAVPAFGGGKIVQTSMAISLLQG